MTEQVLVEKTDGLLVLTLNRPEKKNALTRAMYRTLAAELAEADQDAAVRCVLLLGNGEMFTAGNDLIDFAAINNHAGPPRLEDDNPFLAALTRARKPIVAAVNGRAVGIGVTLLLHCDMVFVADNALLTTPFVNLALVPEAASSLLLPARIGHVRAFEMFVLGEPVDAQQAVHWGIANKIVPLAQLRAVAHAAAVKIAARPPAALIATKRLMRDEASLLERLTVEGEQFSTQLKTAEFAEAFSAFTERRAVDFSKFR